MKRIVGLADHHPWMVIWGLVVFVLVCMAAALGWLIRHESGQNHDQIKVIQQQNVLIENAFVRGCRIAVTNARDSDLAMLGFLEEQLQGRISATATIRTLEEIVKNKQNPDTTCVRPPNKENP